VKEHVDKYISVPPNLAFLFEHQYTDASLSFNGLKGNDHQVAAVLREISSEYGFCFYLTSLERTVEGGCDEYEWEYGGSHEIVDEIDSGVTLNRVVDLNGSEIATDLDFDQENFIQSDPFEGLEPDDEDCSGYTGNEGVTMTHFYRRTVCFPEYILLFLLTSLGRLQYSFRNPIESTFFMPPQRRSLMRPNTGKKKIPRSRK
jgi:hypothetical protein